MPTAHTYSPLIPQKSVEYLRKNTRRYARYAEIHPLQPLKGLREPRTASVSYRAPSPYGETLSSEIKGRPSVSPNPFLIPNWTYTFSAKEKDVETGLSYFGSRYYSSDLSLWLSVDPMSDKYASLSPYVYCADNPVKLVDPDGEKIWIHDEEGGSVANAYYQELVKWASSENINLSLGTDGYLNASFDGEYFDLSDEARNFLHAVYNPNITVDIIATTNDYGDNDYAFFCGTYKGVVYGYNKGEEVAHSYQVVNPNDLRQFDEYHQKPGQTSLHELMESYNAALMSISNCSSDNEGKRKYYKSSHQNAPPQSGTFKKYYTKNGRILREKLPSYKINTSKWFIYFSSESGDKIFKKIPITNR